MHLTSEAQAFVTERHLATLSTLAPDGSIHVVAVGFTFVDGIVRIITRRGSQKVRNILDRGLATVGQVDGGRWISFAGTGRVLTDPESVARAVELYAGRYRQPQPNPERVTIHIEVTKIMGSQGMLAT